MNMKSSYKRLLVCALIVAVYSQLGFSKASVDLDSAAKQETFEYLSAHVPPANDWTNEIHVTNLSDETATVAATVYELVDGSYVQTTSTPLVIESWRTVTYQPEGSGQRWVRLTSDQPLTGVSYFSRRVEGRGEEKTGIPLFTAAERGQSLIISHIPQDRAFYASTVMVNPSEVEVSLAYELYGNDGQRLDHLLTANAPSRLRAHEKWTGFLSPFEGQASLFDDESGAEKVSYVKVVASAPIACFELFGYKATNESSALGTSAIKALPDHSNTEYVCRLNLLHANYASYMILNPNDTPATLEGVIHSNEHHVSIYPTLVIPPHQKVLGLHIKDAQIGHFFSPHFPYGGWIKPDSLGGAIYRGSPNLRVIELTGTGISQIDGSAVTAPATHQAFANPEGTLQMIRSHGQGTVTVTYVRQNGSESIRTILIKVEDFVSIDLPQGLSTLRIDGEGIAAWVIKADEEDDSITQVRGIEIQ